MALERLHREAEAMGVRLRPEDLAAPEPAPEDDALAAPIFAEWLAAPEGERSGTRLVRLELHGGGIPGLTQYNFNHAYRRNEGGIWRGWLTPLGAKLNPAGDYGGKDAKRVLEALEVVNDELDAFGAAVRRPECGDLTPEGVPADEVVKGVLSRMMEGVRLSKLRARARIRVGDPAGALEDVVTVLRVAEHSGNPRQGLIGTLVASSHHGMTRVAIFQGLKLCTWDQEQLVELDSELARHRFLRRFPKMMRWERAGEELT